MADESVNIIFNAVDNASGKVNSIRDSFTELRSKIALAEGVIRTIGKAIDDTAGAFVRYADEIRTISNITGQPVTDVARLIRVTDDYGISVDDLTQAMKKLATEGTPLTTDALADLSDEYLKLNPGSERQLFLTNEFGRSGIVFNQIMLAGGDAIRKQTAAVSDSLIPTQTAIDNALKYKVAMQNLDDQVLAVKISLGEQLLPVLITLADYQTRLMDANEKTGASWLRYIPVIGQYYQIYLVLADAIKGVAKWLETVDKWIKAIDWGKMWSSSGKVNPGGKAGGGAFSGWAMVGDSPGGGRTPYTEYVYAPHGAMVLNQSQMSGKSATPMNGGGFISSPGEVTLSFKSINELKDAIMYGVAKLI